MAGKKTGFFLGRQFSSFEELETELDKFSKANYCKFYKRDSRKITASSDKSRRWPCQRNIEPQLVYCELRYSCIYGGQSRTTSGHEETSIRCQACPVTIYLRASADGKTLEVKVLVTDHNHECSKVLYKQLPCGRHNTDKNSTGSQGKKIKRVYKSRVTKSPKSKVTSHVSSPARSSSSKTAKSKSVKSQSSVKTTPAKLAKSSPSRAPLPKSKAAKAQPRVKPRKKVVGGPRVSYSANTKMKTSAKRFNLWNSDGSPDAAGHAEAVRAMMQNLIQQYGAEVELLSDETSGQARGLFLQTSHMKKTLDAFPEFVAIDGAFSLLQRALQPAYFCLVEDGNSQCQLVAVCLLAPDDQHHRRASFEWFVRMLDTRNPCCATRARYLLTDRSLIQLDVLQHRFPAVPLLPAVFHGPSTFDQQLAASNLGLSKNQRIVCAEYFGKMVSALSEADFGEHYERFRDVAPLSVQSHYASHWHPSRWEWALTARDANRGHFLTNVNSCVEGLNRMLEASAGRGPPLDHLPDRLMNVIARLESEMEIAAKSRSETGTASIKMEVTDIDEQSYSGLLNRQPARLVLKELECATRVELPSPDRHDCYSITTSDCTMVATVRSCSCSFAKATLLPCRHLFAVRAANDLPAYDETLCHERWFRRYYGSYQAALLSQIPLVTGEGRVPELMSSLAELVTAPGGHGSGDVSGERLALLEVLLDSWKAGRRVTLQLVDEEPAVVIVNGVGETNGDDGFLNEVVFGDNQVARIETVVSSEFMKREPSSGSDDEHQPKKRKA